MFPPLPNPVVSTEHGCRDSRLPAVPHTEDAEEKGRRVVLGMSELSNVYSSHHDPLVPQSLKTLLLKQQIQAAQNKVTEAAFRVGQAMEEMAQIRKLLEANSERASQ